MCLETPFKHYIQKSNTMTINSWSWSIRCKKFIMWWIIVLITLEI